MHQGHQLPTNLTTRLVYQADLTETQHRDIHQLQVQCFSDVPYEELMEDFVAPSMAKVVAYTGETLVGCVAVYKRAIEHDGRQIVIGGFGGTCTREDLRGLGIGTAVCRMAMTTLEQESCDIAMLAVGATSGIDKFYERFGFHLLQRPFIFITARGRPKTPERDVAMIVPVCSQEVFEYVLHSQAPLNIGPEQGYW